MKCSWLLPTYVNEVTYERVRDIDFTSAKKLTENLDIKIDSLSQNKAASHESQSSCRAQTAIPLQLTLTEEMNTFLDALTLCETKHVVLSLFVIHICAKLTARPFDVAANMKNMLATRAYEAQVKKSLFSFHVSEMWTVY